MRISDWSSDVCSSDLLGVMAWEAGLRYETTDSDIESSQDGEAIRVSKDYNELLPSLHLKWDLTDADRISLSLAGSIKRAHFNELIQALLDGEYRSEEQTSELQSLMRISYDVFSLNKKKLTTKI